MKKIFWFLLLFGFFNITYAETPTIGDAAGVLVQLTSGVGQFFMALLYSLAFGFFIGALIKFKAHRDIPAQVPINIPFTLLIMSVVFLGLALLMQYTPAKFLGLPMQGGGVSGVADI